MHLVDVSGATGRDPVEDLEVLRRELACFRPELAAKPQIVAANKIDAEVGRVLSNALRSRARALKLPFFRISAVTGAGVPELLESCWQQLALSKPVSVLVKPNSQTVEP